MRDNKNYKMTIIKGISISLLLAGSTVVLAKDDCADLTGCAKKACEVNLELFAKVIHTKLQVSIKHLIT